ncbi:MAG: hypothetical protein JO117_09200 [Verrucomicrobia bacterium]|nr:hypothetical protein [Verrucomicrobiota bacterium]
MNSLSLCSALLLLLLPTWASAQTDEQPPMMPPGEAAYPDTLPPVINAQEQQTPAPEPAAASPSADASPSAVATPAATPLARDGNRAARRNLAQQLPTTATTTTTTTTTAAPAPADVAASAPLPQPDAADKKDIRLNFQGAALSEVLNYLSSAAGFIILQETPVTGTVNVVSRQPINAEEAVDLLNAVLNEKGYIAIRNGRILKIVSRQDAEKRDLPVVTGSDPDKIPRRDSMVTQILPVRYVEVAKLVDNLRPLLSPRASISSNANSNAILLTDTQANIHRVAEIIRALDTSISKISVIHVFGLHYADAKALADVLTELFAPPQRQGNQPQQGPGGFPGFPGFGGGQGRNAVAGGTLTPESEARQAASRVVAVPDAQSNSVIVSAPDEYMDTITEVVNRLDTSISDITETRIFALRFADATELAGLVTTLYADNATTASQQNGPQQGGRNPFFQQQNQRQQNQAPSARTLLQSRVAAVADPRTNAIIVSASHATMDQIAQTIARLDATDVKKQRVQVHTLAHADPDNVAVILRGMFGVDTSTTGTAQQPSTSRLTNRTQNGASSDISSTLNSNSSSNGRSSGAGLR